MFQLYSFSSVFGHQNPGSGLDPDLDPYLDSLEMLDPDPYPDSMIRIHSSGTKYCKYVCKTTS